jgi:hypothetical protein
MLQAFTVIIEIDFAMTKVEMTFRDRYNSIFVHIDLFDYALRGLFLTFRP